MVSSKLPLVRAKRTAPGRRCGGQFERSGSTRTTLLSQSRGEARVYCRQLLFFCCRDRQRVECLVERDVHARSFDDVGADVAENGPQLLSGALAPARRGHVEPSDRLVVQLPATDGPVEQV